MKMKNKTNRNITISAQHTGNGGHPFRVSLIAKSTLELTEEEFNKIEKETNKLVEAGVVVYSESPVSKLTKDQIIGKVMLEADVELKDSLTKAELQEKAEALGVSV